MIRNMVQKFNFFDINFDTPFNRAMDWVLTAASAAYTAYLFKTEVGAWPWIALAVTALGAFMSWWRPLPRFQSYVRSRFIRKRV